LEGKIIPRDYFQTYKSTPKPINCLHRREKSGLSLSVVKNESFNSYGLPIRLRGKLCFIDHRQTMASIFYDTTVFFDLEDVAKRIAHFLRGDRNGVAMMEMGDLQLCVRGQQRQLQMGAEVAEYFVHWAKERFDQIVSEARLLATSETIEAVYVEDSKLEEFSWPFLIAQLEMEVNTECENVTTQVSALPTGKVRKEKKRGYASPGKHFRKVFNQVPVPALVTQTVSPSEACTHCALMDFYELGMYTEASHVTLANSYHRDFVSKRASAQAMLQAQHVSHCEATQKALDLQSSARLQARARQLVHKGYARSTRVRELERRSDRAARGLKC
jgi:hypothetical protein